MSCSISHKLLVIYKKRWARKKKSKNKKWKKKIKKKIIIKKQKTTNKRAHTAGKISKLPPATGFENVKPFTCMTFVFFSLIHQTRHNIEHVDWSNWSKERKKERYPYHLFSKRCHEGVRTCVLGCRIGHKFLRGKFYERRTQPLEEKDGKVGLLKVVQVCIQYNASSSLVFLGKQTNSQIATTC